MSINMGRTTTLKSDYANLVRNNPLHSISLALKSFQGEIQPSNDQVNIDRGCTFEHLSRTSFNKPCIDFDLYYMI